MSVFWDQFFHLMIFLIACTLALGVYWTLKRRLEHALAATHHRRFRPIRGVPMVRYSEEVSSETESAPTATIWEELRNISATIGMMFRELRKRSVLQWIAMDMVIMIAVSALLAIFSSSSMGGLDLYMTTYLPMLGVVLVLFAFTEAVHGNRVVAMICASLILTGVALQSLLNLSDEVPSASELVIFAVVSMFLAIFGCFFLRLMAAVDHRKSRLFLNIVLLLLYLLLVAAGKEIYGTKAWLVVGGFSFQLTELTKLVSLMIFGLTFTDSTMSYEKQLLHGLITLAINALFLVLVNELGTLCVLGLTFFVLGFMYQPDLKLLALTAASLVLLAAAGLFLCYQCEHIVNPPQETVAVQDADETTPPAQTDPTVPSEEGRETAKEESGNSLVRKFLDLGARIWRKFKLRLDLMIAPESVDKLDGGYQNDKAKDALYLSGWLGSVYNVPIPVVESDYIYTFLILKMGVVYGILVLVMMLVLLASGLCKSMTNRIPSIGAVGAAFTLGIVIQSLIAAASAIGAFITIGLPFTFLSDGGTAAVTNYMMAVFIIYAGSNEASVAAAGKKRRCADWSVYHDGTQYVQSRQDGSFCVRCGLSDDLCGVRADPGHWTDPRRKCAGGCDH